MDGLSRAAGGPEPLVLCCPGSASFFAAAESDRRQGCMHMHACMPFRDEITYSYLSHNTRTHDVTRKRRTILGVGAPMRKRSKGD
jgi:hypothetical protein